MNVRTYGDLMDMANAGSNKELKTLLRNSFQRWCRNNHAMPMDPTSVARWRASTIDENEAGELVMTAYRIN